MDSILPAPASSLACNPVPLGIADNYISPLIEYAVAATLPQLCDRPADASYKISERASTVTLSFDTDIVHLYVTLPSEDAAQGSALCRAAFERLVQECVWAKGVWGGEVESEGVTYGMEEAKNARDVVENLEWMVKGEEMDRGSGYPVQSGVASGYPAQPSASGSPVQYDGSEPSASGSPVQYDGSEPSASGYPVEYDGVDPAASGSPVQYDGSQPSTHPYPVQYDGLEPSASGSPVEYDGADPSASGYPVQYEAVSASPAVSGYPAHYPPLTPAMPTATFHAVPLPGFYQPSTFVTVSGAPAPTAPASGYPLPPVASGVGSDGPGYFFHRIDRLKGAEGMVEERRPREKWIQG